MQIRTTVGLLAAATLWTTLAALAASPHAERVSTASISPTDGAAVEPSAQQDGTAQRDEQEGDEKAGVEDVELTLDRIFPEKSFWGPSAGSVSFSHDGRFAAFLYRPYEERRHGADLYVLDTESGKVRRVTTASRMAEFQSDAREVRDDREKKAKAAGVTLADLADEQAERLGWPRHSAAGSWSGEATVEGEGPLGAGEADVQMQADKKGVWSGELRVGLVRLPLKEGKFDAKTRTVSAKIEDERLGVAGTVELTLGQASESMTGAAELERPAQTVRLELTPTEESEAEEDAGPRGVLNVMGERLTLGDVVLDTDAEINDERNGKRPDKLAPRYGGVQGYEWSERADEMLLISDGDVYRLAIDRAQWEEPLTPPADDAGEAKAETEAEADGKDVEAAGDGESEEAADEDGAAEAAEAKPAADAREPVAPYRGDLERLTFTRERESDVQYLPDGSGYTYLRDGALLRVSFGDHRIVQLDPELKDGERMVGYQISPDQKRLVFLANRGDSYWSRGRQVTIVNYRDRFARAQQVTRHMPDDPWPEAFSSVYLYDLGGHESEEGTLERVFTKRISGPRDILRVPEWSPDSSRIAFAAYEQTTGLVKILEAGFKQEESEEDEAAKEAPAEDAEDATEEDGGGEDGETGEGGEAAQDADEAKDEEEEAPEFEIENARVVYEFYHFGGPNTPRMIQPQYLPDSRRLVFLTELSGFRQLHLLEPRYQQLTQLTSGQYEVYPFHLSRDHTTLFATATREDPNQEHVYAIDLETGDMRQLTEREGTYSSVGVRDDGSYLVASHIDFGSPRELVAIDHGDGGGLAVLTDSHPEEAHKLSRVAPEYFSYENRHGQVIHGHMFKPKDWSPEDKRPLLIYVYGGPLGERKMATRGAFAAPSYFFARYMTEEHGYVTATIDPRGASGYGAVFEKANFERVGEPQTEDLVDGARWLVKHAGVDEERMALHGWSFGGFQTQMVMYTEPDVFAAGIAGAGPTQWYNYNSWYTTGTIGPHKPGETNLKEFSLLPLAKNLKGRLLLVHGMEDSNVLYQDTVNVYRELLKNDKEVLVELFVDPTGGHGLGGDVETIGRYRKYEDFLLQHIGAHEAPEAGAESAQAADERQPEPEAAEEDDAVEGEEE